MAGGETRCSRARSRATGGVSIGTHFCNEGAVVVLPFRSTVAAATRRGGSSYKNARHLGRRTGIGGRGPTGEVMGDHACGGMDTRSQCAAHEVQAVGGRCSQEVFRIDLDAGTCTCPAGALGQPRLRRDGQLSGFVFHKASCAACLLKEQCTKGRRARWASMRTRRSAKGSPKSRPRLSFWNSTAPVASSSGPTPSSPAMACTRPDTSAVAGQDSNLLSPPVSSASSVPTAQTSGPTSLGQRIRVGPYWCEAGDEPNDPLTDLSQSTLLPPRAGSKPATRPAQPKTASSDAASPRFSALPAGDGRG